MAAAAHAIEKPAGGSAAASAKQSVEVEDAADGRWQRVLGLRCELTVDLPMPAFKIADLLKLGKGSVINAQWRVGKDVPLCLNGTRIGWIEFELVADHLAVRLTELA